VTNKLQKQFDTKQILLFLTFFIFVIEILFRILIRCIPITEDIPNYIEWLISASIRMISVAFVIKIAMQWKGNTQINWGLKSKNLKIDLLLSLPFILIGTLILSLYHFNTWQIRHLIAPIANQPSNIQLFSWIIAGVIIAPICEEILFRSIFFNALMHYFKGKNWWKITLSSSISSVTFATLHITSLSLSGFQSAIIPFICGLFGCVFFQWRKNIFTATIVHSFANLYLFILAYI